MLKKQQLQKVALFDFQTVWEIVWSALVLYIKLPVLLQNISIQMKTKEMWQFQSNIPNFGSSAATKKKFDFFSYNFFWPIYLPLRCILRYICIKNNFTLDWFTHGFMVKPKWHPGYHDDEESWDVDGNDIVRKLTLESHVHCKAAVLAWKGN